MTIYHGVGVIFPNCLLTLDKTKAIFLRNTIRIILITQRCSNTEKSLKQGKKHHRRRLQGCHSVFPPQKLLLEEEVKLLIVSTRWYPKYCNGFSTEPSYQIKLKIGVLIAILPGKNITNHYRAQESAKANTNLLHIQLSWINPRWQLSTMQPLTHSPLMGERIGKVGKLMR